MQSITDLIFYLFTPNPPQNTQLIYFYIFLAIIILAASFTLKFYIKKNKKNKALKRSLRQYPGRLQIIATLLLIYSFFRYAGAPLFSMRIILGVLLTALIYTIYKFYQSLRIEYPREKKKLHEQEERNKYLPRRKNSLR